MKTVRAPGRVNLIGEHTDYQDGWCLPIAIDREAVVRYTATDNQSIIVHSAQLPGEARVGVDGGVGPTSAPWASNVANVVNALIERGYPIRGVDAHLDSSVPLGSGLSSSAAFGVAITIALADANGAVLDHIEVARVAQRAEHLGGVPCGIMDQMASAISRAGHAMLLDCRTLHIEAIALPDDLGVIVVHSGLPRTLADSQYAQRRAACEQASARLGIVNLRDATLDAVSDDPFARHVVSENLRVHAFVAALRANDTNALGELLNASHESLARDYLVSTPELDQLVEILRDTGAYGARLTGAGFGGCVVALAPLAEANAIAQHAALRYRAETDLIPFAFVSQACAGAEIIE